MEQAECWDLKGIKQAEEGGWGVIDFSCLATLATQPPTPGLALFSPLMEPG